MKAGDTLIAALPNTSIDSHLWVVVSDPSQSEDVLIVNFTSWRADKDQACVLNPGDHPYITNQTCVNYKDAKLCKASALDSLIQNGQMQSHAPMNKTVLKKIREAVLDSWVKQDHAQLLVNQGIVEF